MTVSDMKLKIVYAGIRNENYVPERSPSFEYTNFYETLHGMPGTEVIEYPYDTILQVGRKRWNQELLSLAKKEKPDMLFAFMYTDEFEPAALDALKEMATTVAWFADDYWRFWSYSRRWAPHFTYAVTTYPRAVEWYQKAGYKNVILSQWAHNTKLCLQPTTYNLQPAHDIDVSFLGQHKRARARAVNALREAGIEVKTFGTGWPSGRVSHEEMLRIFARSKINLNLNDRPGLWEPASLARIFLKKSINRLVPDLHIFQNTKAYLHIKNPHIHARPFELAGCGAFVISGWAEGMEQYYEPDREMVFYHSTKELVEKTKMYLARPEDRARIAKAGYDRTLREHTYEKRFATLFERMKFH